MPHFRHHSDRTRILAMRLNAGGLNGKAVTRQVPRPAFRHL
jgi:hypothetical protein